MGLRGFGGKGETRQALTTARNRKHRTPLPGIWTSWRRLTPPASLPKKKQQGYTAPQPNRDAPNTRTTPTRHHAELVPALANGSKATEKPQMLKLAPGALKNDAAQTNAPTAKADG